MVGWERSKAGCRSQTHASPSWCESTSESSRSRTGSATALSIGAIAAACSALSGSRASGVQPARGSSGAHPDIDMHE